MSRWRLMTAILVVAGGAFADQPPDLPSVSLDGMDEHVVAQLDEARSELRALLESDADRARVASAWGRLGQLYLAYDIVPQAEAALVEAATLAPSEPRWSYLLGALHQNERRLDAALSAYDTVLRLRPGDLPTWIRRGNVLSSLERNDEARRCFETAQGIQPTAAALAGLAELASRAGDHRAAADLLLQALDLQPGADALHYRLAQAFRSLGDRDAARRHLALRGEAEPGFPDPEAQAILDLATGSSVQLMYGNRALRSGDVELAIERYRAALAESPGNAVAHRALAAALVRVGDTGGAIEHYREALALSPENPSWHYNLAILLAENGRGDEAEDHLRAALELHPGYHNARFNLASLLGREGRTAEAVDELERLLERQPGDQASRRLLARGLAQLGRIADAETQLRMLLEQETDDQTVQRDLADLVARSGRYGEAAGLLRRVVESDPGDEEARFAEAMALLLAGKEGLAHDRLEEGLSFLPGSRQLAHLLARLLATSADPALRDGARAAALARRLLRQQPEPGVAETLAMALAEQGRFEDATALLDRLVSQAIAAGVDPERVAQLERRRRRFAQPLPCRAPWSPSGDDC